MRTSKFVVSCLTLPLKSAAFLPFVSFRAGMPQPTMASDEIEGIALTSVVKTETPGSNSLTREQSNFNALFGIFDIWALAYRRLSTTAHGKGC